MSRVSDKSDERRFFVVSVISAVVWGSVRENYLAFIFVMIRISANSKLNIMAILPSKCLSITVILRADYAMKLSF